MTDLVQRGADVAGEVIELVAADHDPVGGAFPDSEHGSPALLSRMISERAAARAS
jgi:hypothetical protein